MATKTFTAPEGGPLKTGDGATTKSILHNGGDGGRILVNSKYDKVDLDNKKIITGKGGQNLGLTGAAIMSLVEKGSEVRLVASPHPSEDAMGKGGNGGSIASGSHFGTFSAVNAHIETGDGGASEFGHGENGGDIGCDNNN